MHIGLRAVQPDFARRLLKNHCGELRKFDRPPHVRESIPQGIELAMKLVENPSLGARIVGIPPARGGAAHLPGRPRHLFGTLDPSRRHFDLGLQHGDEHARLPVLDASVIDSSGVGVPVIDSSGVGVPVMACSRRVRKQPSTVVVRCRGHRPGRQSGTRRRPRGLCSPSRARCRWSWPWTLTERS